MITHSHTTRLFVAVDNVIGRMATDARDDVGICGVEERSHFIDTSDCSVPVSQDNAFGRLSKNLFDLELLHDEVVSVDEIDC